MASLHLTTLTPTHHTYTATFYSEQTIDFKIIKLLGKGGFSKVFKAQDNTTGKTYAIKVVNLLKLKDIGKLVSSTEISFQLNHPFIIRTYSFLNIENPTKKCILMEQLSGLESFHFLVKNKSFTLDETRFFISSILLAVKYLHDKHIIHRDLKLENIYIQESGYPKVYDFDFMKNLTESDGRTSTSCGSPDYAAPELIQGLENYKGTCVDMWSIGVITYICLTLTMPFQSESEKIEILFRNIMCEQPSYDFSIFMGKDGRIAQNFIRKLLEKEPSSRMNVDEALANPFFNTINMGEIESQRQPSPLSFLTTPERI